jgi:hypothetical protein
MPGVVTTCQKCGAQFQWNTDVQSRPDCPRCGHNPRRQAQKANMSGLLRQLGSSDPGESSRAAAELGERGDPSAVGWLIAALGHPHARIAAVIALGKLRDERAVEPLIAVLRDSSGPSSDAARALAAIGSPRALKAVADEIYSVHPSRLPDIFRSFRARGKRIVPLIAPMADSPSPPIKEHARAILREFG